jgi:hypothetical protein
MSSSINRKPINSSLNQYQDMMQQLLRFVTARLEHGFGEITFETKIGKNNVREVLLKSGNSLRYRITLDQLSHEVRLSPWERNEESK